MKPDDYVPSTRMRICNLVQAYAARNQLKSGKVWTRLYDEFESRTNRPWRKLAYQNAMTALDVIHAQRKADELLVLARELLNTQAQDELPVEVVR